MTDPTAREVLERWPGYTEQSWSERFAELDRQYTAAHARWLETMIAVQSRASRLVEEARREERERCARVAVEVRQLFEQQPEDLMSMGARFGAKAVGEAICSLPDAPERDGERG